MTAIFYFMCYRTIAQCVDENSKALYIYEKYFDVYIQKMTKKGRQCVPLNSQKIIMETCHINLVRKLCF